MLGSASTARFGSASAAASPPFHQMLASSLGSASTSPPQQQQVREEVSWALDRLSPPRLPAEVLEGHGQGEASMTGILRNLRSALQAELHQIAPNTEERAQTASKYQEIQRQLAMAQVTNQDLLAANEELQEENLRLKARLQSASAVRASATVAKQATAEAEKKLLWWKESCDQIERGHQKAIKEMSAELARVQKMHQMSTTALVALQQCAAEEKHQLLSRLGQGKSDTSSVHVPDFPTIDWANIFGGHEKNRDTGLGSSQAHASNGVGHGDSHSKRTDGTGALNGNGGNSLPASPPPVPAADSNNASSMASSSRDANTPCTGSPATATVEVDLRTAAAAAAAAVVGSNANATSGVGPISTMTNGTAHGSELDTSREALALAAQRQREMNAAHRLERTKRLQALRQRTQQAAHAGSPGVGAGFGIGGAASRPPATILSFAPSVSPSPARQSLSELLQQQSQQRASSLPSHRVSAVTQPQTSQQLHLKLRQLQQLGAGVGLNRPQWHS